MATASRSGVRLSVETIIADRHAIQAKERALVTALSGALKGLGYTIVTKASGARTTASRRAVAPAEPAAPRRRAAKRARSRRAGTGTRARKGA